MRRFENHLAYVIVLGWTCQHVCLHGKCVSLSELLQSPQRVVWAFLWLNRFKSSLLWACWYPADSFTLLSAQRFTSEVGGLGMEPPWHCKHLVNVPHYSPFEVLFTFYSIGAKKAPLKFHVSHGPLMFMLANAICLIPHQCICILISSLNAGSRNKGCMCY